jgi:carbonic anhydrase
VQSAKICIDERVYKKMVIDEILAYNEQFVQQNKLPIIGHTPRKRMAVVTCMDCRLVQMFEQVLGLERGDVIELRTAGATISEPDREGGLNDLIRSLAGGIYLLGVREVAVIGHTDCGLARADPTMLIASMQALGVDPQPLIEKAGPKSWIGAFDDVHVNVKEVVDVIRNSPYLPKIPVHGLVIDIETGKLEMVERG